MTRKDFELIAEVLSGHYRNGTEEQKAEIAKEITDTMSRIANKPASYTYVVFDEVATEDWAIGGNLLGQ